MLRLPSHIADGPQGGTYLPITGKGAWEYELTGGDRVFYIPDPKLKKVTVYYAGPHRETAPVPPASLG